MYIMQDSCFSKDDIDSLESNQNQTDHNEEGLRMNHCCNNRLRGKTVGYRCTELLAKQPNLSTLLPQELASLPEILALKPGQ